MTNWNNIEPLFTSILKREHVTQEWLDDMSHQFAEADNVVQETIISAMMLRAWNDPTFSLLPWMLYVGASSRNLRVHAKTLLIAVLYITHRGTALSADDRQTLTLGYIKALSAAAPHMQNALFSVLGTGRVERFERSLMDAVRSESEEADDEEEEGQPGMAMMNPDSEVMKQGMHMAQCGFDMNRNMFQQMCHHSFFSHKHNWFIPFDKTHPALNTSSPLPPSLRILSSVMGGGDTSCEQDKYAMSIFMSSVQEMGNIEVKAITNDENGTHENSDVAETLAKLLEVKAQTQKNPLFIMRSLARELYRFFTLSPWVEEYPNPFRNPIFLHNIIPNLPAEFYLNNAPQALAVGHFGRFTSHLPQSQRLDIIAELLKSNPADPTLLAEKGEILMEQQQWEEALKIFSALEYKGQKLRTSTQAIAICCQELGNLDRAERYYRKLEQLS